MRLWRYLADLLVPDWALGLGCRARETEPPLDFDPRAHYRKVEIDPRSVGPNRWPRAVP